MKKFPLISGHISIDLVNTEIVSHGKRRDHLVKGPDLMDWLDEMKTNNPYINKKFLDDVGEETLSVLNGLRRCRLFLRKCFEDIAEGRDDSRKLIDYSEKQVQICPVSLKMVDNHLYPCPIGKPEDAILSLIAIDVLKLIEADELRFIKHCANSECVLLFIDVTGRRKWCSMKICGNRMKAARRRNS